MKPTYEELLDTLFDVTQALHNTLVQGGQMTSADRDQRWTTRTRPKVFAPPAGTLIIGNSRSAADQLGGRNLPPAAPVALVGRTPCAGGWMGRSWPMGGLPIGSCPI
jgi:hypothetical protein